MLLELSADDGSQLDFKLIDLLKKYDLPCTFYVPIICELSQDEIVEISKEYEIGGHTVTHQILTETRTKEEARIQIENCKKYLETMIKKPVTKFCYPRGRYNDEVKEMVKGAGFTQARTTKLFQTTIPDDPFEWHTTIHAFQNPKYGDKKWYDEAMKIWEEVPEYYHLWLHSKEVENNDDWGNLERVFAFITSK